MEKFYSTRYKCEIQQIRKDTARKLFNAGVSIFMMASNMIFDNVWSVPMQTDKSHLGWHQNFDSICNEFKYYNCDCERGYYPRFYVKVTDLQN
jgi:hypothetical protein